MMKIPKVKILSILVVVLLVINITTIAGAWKLLNKVNNADANTSSAKNFLITKLEFDEEQQAQFETLRKAYFEQIAGLLASIQNEKSNMYTLLKSNNPDTALTYMHIARIMQQEERLERNTFEHFRKVRALCSDEQKQHFDVIIDQVLRMIMKPKNPVIMQQDQPLILP
jgi:hypothetical protein